MPSYLKLVLGACCASASAFVLHGAPSGARATVAASVAAASSAPLRACEMNLADRFSRLVKSNLNDLANKLEDPEKVLEQAVVDMQKDLVKVRQAYAEVSASSKRMEEQTKLAEAEGAKWYERAQLALSKGEEELAKEALTRRKQQLEMADSLREQIEGQQGSITSLYESMKELEAKSASQDSYSRPLPRSPPNVCLCLYGAHRGACVRVPRSQWRRQRRRRTRSSHGRARRRPRPR